MNTEPLDAAGIAAPAFLRPVGFFSPGDMPAFRPSSNYPDQLRPQPHAAVCFEGLRIVLCIVQSQAQAAAAARRAPVVDMTISVTHPGGNVSCSADLTSPQARALALQLLQAAEQLDAGV